MPHDIASLWQHGLDVPGVALTLNRIAVGTFFVFSGYHKLFNAKRHASLLATFKADGVPPQFQWFVPLVEFFGGLGVAFGFLAPLAAFGCLAIISVAICVDGCKRVREYEPIDFCDMLDDYLYLPEVLYAIMLVVVICTGGGWLSLDHLLWRLA